MESYAGLDLANKIFSNTIACCDQDYLNLGILSLSSKINDRTDFINNLNLENPGKSIADINAQLSNQGVSVIGIPCNTTHTEIIFSNIKYNLMVKTVRLNC